MTEDRNDAHKISRFRKTGDHPARRAIALAAKRMLEKLGVTRSTLSLVWSLARGRPRSAPRSPSKPDCSWNHIPTAIQDQIVELALDAPERRPRELAARFTDVNKYFVSESSVYRLLEAHDLIISPADIVIKAADEFKDKTFAPNQLWQTDFHLF